jgi:hypothetical protein
MAAVLEALEAVESLPTVEVLASFVLADVEHLVIAIAAAYRCV